MFDFMDMSFDQAEWPESTGPYIPDAAECMRCGMCVGACPTFRVFERDEETPRRRIRTLGKLLVEQQAIGEEERHHLLNCLQCRACEPACPSKMAYAQLFGEAQKQLQAPPKGFAKVALRLIETKRWRTRLMPFLAFYLKSGLQKPLRRSGLLRKLGLAEAEALLGKPASGALDAHYPATGARRGRVALFTGCIAEHFDRHTLSASITLLNAIGYEVSVPREQGCCGAIHHHNGQESAALMANNVRIFNALEVDAVIHCASGCGAMLSEYPGDEDAVETFRRRLTDIGDFLLTHWPDDLTLRPANLKVAVHEPCSQRNVLKNQQTLYALLAKVPGLVSSPLPDNPICCGAGGTYMLTHPETAKRLRDMKRQTIAESSVDLVVSSNYSCALFLGEPSLKIEHPVSLLARLLP